MFFFFLENMLKVLGNATRNSYYFTDIKTFIVTIQNAFEDFPCKGHNIVKEYQLHDKFPQGFNFYLYRNIGLPDIEMPDIIKLLYSTINTINTNIVTIS